MPEQEVVVEKVGRRWATIAGVRYRIDVKTLQADGGGYSSPGTCYLDKDAFIAEREAVALYGELRQRMGSRPPAEVSAVDIRQAASLLGIAL